MTSYFVGYFFVPGPLGGLRKFSGDVFGYTDSIGSFLKNICRVSKNRLFPGFLVKNDHIFKSAFFTRLCP